jgi:hypothetical protein
VEINRKLYSRFMIDYSISDGVEVDMLFFSNLDIGMRRIDESGAEIPSATMSNA